MVNCRLASVLRLVARMAALVPNRDLSGGRIQVVSMACELAALGQRQIYYQLVLRTVGEAPVPSRVGLESARSDLCFDSRQVDARTPEIRLIGCPR